MEIKNDWPFTLFIVAMTGAVIVAIMQGIGPDKIINLVASWF